MASTSFAKVLCLEPFRTSEPMQRETRPSAAPLSAALIAERLGEANQLDIVGADQIRSRFNAALKQMQATLHGTTLEELVAVADES